MTEPFLAQIMIVSFNFPPKGWAMCNGQFLPINQNQALFALLGTTYGGNGQTTFALPNFQGRVPVHMGEIHTMGQVGGSVAETVGIQQLPTHIHSITKNRIQATVKAGAAANTTSPEGAYFAENVSETKRFSNRSDASMANIAPTLGNVGGSQPHGNIQPYLVLNYVIALQGVFPSRN